MAGSLTIISCHKSQNHLETFLGQTALYLLRQMHNLISCDLDLELRVNLVHKIEDYIFPVESFFKRQTNVDITAKKC